MDLRRRLARLDHLTRKPEAAAPPDAAVPSGGDGAPAAGDHAAVLRGPLGLGRHETPAGPLWARTDREPDLPCPAGPLPDLTGILPTPPPPHVRWSDLLLLDLETTGLAGGTGTLPLLVGLGWWEADALVTRQLFLDAPGREAPLLAEVARLAASRQVVVTYNGASFDLPLLRTRARLARRDDPCGRLHGCDLLAGARRLWGRGLPDCRQQTVEQLLRGTARGPGDIDGSRIPAAYRTYLRAAQPSLLPAVLRHNRRDLAGMGEILRALADAAGELEAGPGPHRAPALPWTEAWGRALACERRRVAGAAAAWASAMLAGAPRPLPAVARRDAIRLLKRVGGWQQVADLVGEGLREDPADRHLHYEAAVLWEHRLDDPLRALSHAEALGEDRRVARLRRRLTRAARRPAAGAPAPADAAGADGCPLPDPGL